MQNPYYLSKRLILSVNRPSVPVHVYLGQTHVKKLAKPVLAVLRTLVSHSFCGVTNSFYLWIDTCEYWHTGQLTK